MDSETMEKTGNGHVASDVDQPVGGEAEGDCPGSGGKQGNEGAGDRERGPEDVEAGGDDGEEEEEGEEGEEEEEEEPSLKYERIVGAIPDLLKRDSASALAIVNRTMVRSKPNMIYF